MKSVLKYMVCLVVLVSLSCRRQTLEQPHLSKISIPVTVDWSQSKVDRGDISNMSLYFFPEDGSEPFIKISGDIDSVGVSLPIGHYSVLLFNGTVGDLYSLRFSNEQSFGEFSVSAGESAQAQGSFYQRAQSDVVWQVEDRLAVWRTECFEVTAAMASCPCAYWYSTKAFVDSLILIAPTPVTVDNTITVRMENLSSAMVVEGALKGSATDANLSTNGRGVGSSESVYLCDFLSREYDAGGDDGTIDSSFLTFGKRPVTDAVYLLELNVVLRSGELMTFERDVTEQVVASDDFNIIISLTDSTDMISLPEASAPTFGVEGWGSSESVALM